MIHTYYILCESLFEIRACLRIHGRDMTILDDIYITIALSAYVYIHTVIGGSHSSNLQRAFERVDNRLISHARRKTTTRLVLF